jgi:endo-1,4-beta-xylanase
VASAVNVFGQNVEVLRTDFEKGTQKWEARGARVSIKTTKKQWANGKKSLKVSGRRENWQGTQLNITSKLEAGKTYLFTVSVKLDKGEKPDDIKMTMQGGDNKFYGVGAVSANDQEWKTFSGKFTNTRSAPYLLIYIEASRVNTSYFIDDFKIETVGIPEQAGVILTTDFQDKTSQNWGTRGEGVEMFSAAAGTDISLLVNKRSEPWHGLAMDVSNLFFKGRTYQLKISAKLFNGNAAAGLKMTVEETAPDGTKSYVQVSPLTTVMDTRWETITGKYNAKTQDHKLILIVESAGASTAFFIDNFEVKIP